MRGFTFCDNWVFEVFRSQGQYIILLSVSKSATRSWTFLEDAERMFDIDEDPKDVAHCWFAENDERRKLAARAKHMNPARIGVGGVVPRGKVESK